MSNYLAESVKRVIKVNISTGAALRPARGCMLALGLLLTLTGVALEAAERKVDYAVEDAAYQTIKELTNSDIEAGRIAFVGLFDSDEEMRQLAPVFRAGVIGAPGKFQFYTRDEGEWDTLVEEIDFANRRSDVMDEETIQKFGDIKGVDAVLYGDVREARLTDDNEAVARLAVTLAAVETGEILWEGNVEGRYSVTPEPEALPENVRNAAIEAGREAARELEDWSAGLDENVQLFFLPLEGENGAQIGELMVGEVVGSDADKVSFFSPPAESDGKRMLDRLARDLYGPGASSETHRQRIAEQLEQIAAEEQGTERDVPVNAVLMGRVTGITESESFKDEETKITLNLKLLNPLDYQNLWSTNVEGVSSDDITEGWLIRLREFVSDNFTMVLAVAVGALVVLFLFGKLMKAVTRPR